MKPKSSPLKIGTAVEKPGSLSRGEFELGPLPTGGMEKISVVIAAGDKAGPTVLITANIHGDEVVGTLVCHRFLESLDLAKLAGRVVVIPSLNPSGMRALTRHSELQAVDPNRKWPSAHPNAGIPWEDPSDWLSAYTALEHAPGPQERAWTKLFDALASANPDYHIDLHSFTAVSIPFSFLDRVFHSGNEKQASELHKKSEQMLQAIGFSVFREASFSNLVKTDMYRTTSGAFQNLLGIPAATIELGATSMADFHNRAAAVVALENLLKWAEMLPGKPRKLEGVKVIQPDKPLRVLQYPYAPTSGIFDYAIEAGGAFKKGETLGVFRTLAGEHLCDVKAAFDGYIIGWRKGVAHHEGGPLAWVAVEDKMLMTRSWVG
jgi:predicted deacylase